MSLRPVFGHVALRARLARAVHRGRLPASLLFTGPRGVGKQRLALWVAQLLQCESAEREGLTEPCGRCAACRYAEELQHPDIHWFFPRKKPEKKTPSPEVMMDDLAEAINERREAQGVWSASDGTAALYIDTMRGLLPRASKKPAMGHRTVFVVGDAERMVSQEGSDQAANAFLKLLEEPPPGTTIVLTSSEPGALLPTIRSRVVTVRVNPLGADDVMDFLDDPVVREAVGEVRARDPHLVQRLGGCPGRMLELESNAAVAEEAERLLAAALAPRTPEGEAARALVAGSQGVAGARGTYADVLDALTVALHAHVQRLVDHGDERGARRAAQGVAVVEAAKAHTQHNVTPLLLTATLLDDLSQLLG